MAINIDTSKPFRRPLDLQRLVQAVVSAGTADEAFWVECKNNEFDLTQAPGRFKTAQVILSFANRMPDAAATICDGLAYVIIGAEPGRVDGTAVHDGADLDNWLIRYLGGDGPVWSPNYIKHDDKDVLVIVVEPPKWGDHIHTLRQGWEKAQLGTIYYRSGSVSRQANADEIRLLEERILRGQRTPELDGLQVTYSIDPPDDSDDLTAQQRAAWPRHAIAVDLDPNQVDEWIDARRKLVRAHHEDAINSARQAKDFRPFAPTTVDDEAIEAHLAECRETLFDASRRVLIKAGYSLVTMSVTNPSTRILDHVELTLTPAVPFSAFEQGHVPKDLAKIPAPPKPPKTTIEKLITPRSFLPSVPMALGLADYRIPNQWLEIDKTSITLKMGQIRPEKTATSSSFHLLLHRHPLSQAVAIPWTLTSTTAEGVQRGSFEIPVTSPRQIVLGPRHGLPNSDSNV